MQMKHFFVHENKFFFRHHSDVPAERDYHDKYNRSPRRWYDAEYTKKIFERTKKLLKMRYEERKTYMPTMLLARLFPLKEATSDNERRRPCATPTFRSQATKSIDRDILDVNR